MKRKSRMALLESAVHRWLELPKVSRRVLAAAVVDAAKQLGFTELLAAEGITFANTADPYNDGRINAQKIFRWLGQYEENNPMPERLWHVEQVLLAAMPLDLRLQYLNAVYAVCRVTVVADGVSDGVVVARGYMAMAAAMTKENAEAQVAVIDLGAEPSKQQVVQCHQELRESRATTQASIDLLETEYPFLKQAQAV
ncbi:hypothetical protein [Shewanella sp.]|uniref:hypothetical protein n=1 Tax=Shewanella sp. TaxID=50422 RepID=UPI003D0F6BD0